jgi:DeoR family transcriptional regulator, suf operon transcriptional repressor
MTYSNPAIAGHRGLRAEILLEIKKSQPVTAKELSSQFGVSVNAVRRHLKELEVDGSVNYNREQRGMGAPVYVYRLTGRGESLFPNRYEGALTGLLQHVEERAGRGEISRMFADQFRARAESLKTELADQPVEVRLHRLVRLLSEEGYMAEWNTSDGTIRLAEHNCAIRAVAERYPEVCAAERRFLGEVLAAQVERRTHITEGSNSCEYSITPGAASDGAEEAAGRPDEKQA